MNDMTSTTKKLPWKKPQLLDITLRRTLSGRKIVSESPFVAVTTMETTPTDTLFTTGGPDGSIPQQPLS